MPELPDLTVYLEALRSRVCGAAIERVRLQSAFLVRSVDPPLEMAEGRRVQDLLLVGKRIVFALEDELYLAIHLMIAGRLHWKEPGAKVPGKIGLAAFDFEAGTLTLTEASQKKRAALHLLRGQAALSFLDAGGLPVLGCDLGTFGAVLRSENHTLKRALTDPRLLAGIGNAYSDEILHRARLSPIRLTQRMTDDEVTRLHAAVQETLQEWITRLTAQAGGKFPEKVTAFHPEMAVHGRYGQPCPECGSPVQRIVHAENESNYCATCQTKGKLLADRALSRLLKGDWPRTLEELEEQRAR